MGRSFYRLVTPLNSELLDKWVCVNDVNIDFARRGKPADNVGVDSFNEDFGKNI